ncbi:MAG TPA: hypothetical protein VLH85_07930 [Levilinea sp.]|nr:hypothetical protein [Levilinea sp.]
MEELLRFLKQYEAWIYALLGVVAIIYFRKLLNEWQEWRSSTFGLERESARRRLSATLAVVVLLILLATAEFVLVSFVAPVYPSLNVLSTPTINVMTTPVETFAGAGERGEETSMPQTPQSTAENGGCRPGVLEWTYPAEGESVYGVVRLKATANLPNIGFFKYEYSEVNSENWVTIAAENTQQVDEELDGSWNTQALVPGDYRLRLVMMDNENQDLPACIITVRVIPQPEE